MITQEVLPNFYKIKHRLQYIAINEDIIRKESKRINKLETSNWESSFIYHDASTKGIHYLLFFSALSFCYWPLPKWKIRKEEYILDGSMAMFSKLTDMFEEFDFRNTNNVKGLNWHWFKRHFEGRQSTTLCYLRERFDFVSEIIEVLNENFKGSVLNLFEDARFNVDEIIFKLYKNFHVFEDQVEYKGVRLYFLKKAQEFVSLVHEKYRSAITLRNINTLTVSSDYKLPQIMGHLGFISYTPSFVQKINNNIPFTKDSESEVIELRVATILVGDILSRLVNDTATNVSNKLWTMSQKSDKTMRPYPKIYSIHM